MIKRYHEAPLSIFKNVQNMTDGDYALVHLFETNLDYLEAFIQAVADGRDVILDNSIFELGTAFNGDRFAYWVERLKPTWYIVPDSWKHGKDTVQMFYDFIEKYPNLPGKRIGVAQGWTVDEVAYSYRSLEPQCDMLAFNLDFSSVFYDSILQPPPSTSNVVEMRKYKESLVPYCVAMSIGRYMVLKALWIQGVINPNKPHHLLGCGVPQEVQWYPKEWTWVRSIDTSNPVIAGMRGWSYDPELGISKKAAIKLCDHVNHYVPWDNRETIYTNIQIMKEWCTTWKE